MGTSDASSQSAVKARKACKLFNVHEATRALPLVRRIVGDVVENYQHLQQLNAAGGAAPRANAARDDDLAATRERLHELVEELTEIGVELKDLRIGLIDFPARFAGRDIYLCWKLGETTLGYWHDCTAGYAGRRPIRELMTTD